MNEERPARGDGGSTLEERIADILAHPQPAPAEVLAALAELWAAHCDLARRIERISRISDGYQSIARESAMSLSDRADKQLRQLSKVARISDRYQQMMRDLNIALKDASTHDVLTGLANRRLLVERLKEETERSRRYGRSFCIVMVDIDRFKQFNDGYGHEIGDRILVETARTLDAELRDPDICGRWGGEEFLVLLPEATLEAASVVAERLCRSVRGLALPVGTEALSVTVSAGVSHHLNGESYSQTIDRADRALLQAKRNGRNRFEIAADAAPAP